MKILLPIITTVLILFTSCSKDSITNSVDDNHSNYVAGEYQLPKGVAIPWVAPDVERPERPVDWSTEQLGYYFVDYSSGDDDENEFGTPDSPRKSIPNPVPAGSYVVVKGNYHYVQGSIHIRGEGNGEPWVAGESGPVWVVGESTEQRAEITEKLLLVAGSYVYIEDFYIHSDARIQLGSYKEGYQVDHILVRNCEIKGNDQATGGILINTVGLQSEPARNIIIFNNQAHSIGVLDSETDVDARGCAISGYTSNMWVLNNVFHSSSAGLQVEAGNATLQPTTHHIYIGHNHIYNIAQAGIGVKYAFNVIISENTIHDIIDTPWSPAKGVGFQYAPDYVWIIFNKIYNSNIGIRGGSDNGGGLKKGVYIIGNEVTDIRLDGKSKYGATEGVGIEINNGASPRYIVNNTLVNNDVAIGNGYYNSTMIMENNLISNSIYHDIRLVPGYQTASQSILNNTHFDSVAKIQWGDSRTLNLEEFQDAYDKGEASICGNPLFTTDTDFTLQQSSSAIGAGLSSEELSVDVYDLFENLYGLNIRYTKDNVSLLNKGQWNIGAY